MNNNNFFNNKKMELIYLSLYLKIIEFKAGMLITTNQWIKDDFFSSLKIDSLIYMDKINKLNINLTMRDINKKELSEDLVYSTDICDELLLVKDSIIVEDYFINFYINYLSKVNSLELDVDDIVNLNDQFDYEEDECVLDVVEGNKQLIKIIDEGSEVNE